MEGGRRAFGGYPKVISRPKIPHSASPHGTVRAPASKGQKERKKGKTLEGKRG